jgi:hypothetical protein
MTLALQQNVSNGLNEFRFFPVDILKVAMVK